ncbi:DinB family protein [Salipaludibacillus daqingensis]|uniref:DinB family protein n=1 Tax=Salipaludibacillus daqingensis TaxID=3041001 RepID=UPI0024755B60|nr:DinB family protein [Salipaludibacillus daqingensis]
MDPSVIKQLSFVRQLTTNAVKGLSEKELDNVPENFNNNVRWNLGHIYVIQEKLAFHAANEAMQLPENFERLFARGTKPNDWNEEHPSIDKLLEMLTEQPNRIQKELGNRIDEKVNEPYTTSSGLTLMTIGEFLSFSLYHEGLHFNTIKLLKRFSSNHL